MKLGLPVEGLGGRLGRWFELHGEELEAPHLLSAWFDATTDCGEVVTHARRWLGRHGTHLEARFVLASWIYRLDDVGEVAPYVDRWTGKNGTCHEALLVFCAWYHNGGDQGRYRDLVLALIEQFPTSEKAWFLTKFASGWRDLPERSIRAICSMCGGFRNDPDSLWRTSRLCWHISQDSWDLAREIIRTALDCLEIHCADGQLNQESHLPVAIVFNFLTDVWQAPEFEDRILRNLAAAVSSGRVFHSEANFVQGFGLPRIVFEALRNGYLDVDRDRCGLIAYAQMLARSDHGAPAFAEFLALVSRRFPSDLWSAAAQP